MTRFFFGVVGPGHRLVAVVLVALATRLLFGVAGLLRQPFVGPVFSPPIVLLVETAAEHTDFPFLHHYFHFVHFS